MIRQPIVVLVGHVDHGKSSILEKLKDISILKYEPGAITQKISSVNIPFEDIRRISGSLLDQLKIKLTIPGLLLIDTPGHASFTNLRKRGGSIADIAILVVDINELIKPQTEEAIEILKTYKTPFIVALNKIDSIYGWKTTKDQLIKSISMQSDNVRKKLDDQLYTLVGKLHGFNISSERFDKIDNFTKQVAIVPCSAKTGQGIPEIVMVIAGLAQRYLEDKLKIHEKEETKGTILEVREEKGLGIIIEVIIYSGSLKVNDQLVIGNIDKPIITRVRSLFVKDQKSLKNSNQVNAASSVIIFAPDIKEAIAGMPLIVANKNTEEAEKKVQKEVHEIVIERDQEGIIIKADSLGSLEALISLLKEKNIQIKRATIGNITKKDITEALASKDPLNKVILAFNVTSEDSSVKIISSDIIYKIIEDFEKWREDASKNIVKSELGELTPLCKIELMEGYVFRQSNPAVIGVDIISGRLKTNITLLNLEGKEITRVKSIQHEKKNINEITSGNQVALALSGVTIGRQIKEKDILYSDLTEAEFKKYKKLKRFLNPSEIKILKEIAEIKRKENPSWGM